VALVHGEKQILMEVIGNMENPAIAEMERLNDEAHELECEEQEEVSACCGHAILNDLCLGCHDHTGPAEKECICLEVREARMEQEANNRVKEGMERV